MYQCQFPIKEFQRCTDQDRYYQTLRAISGKPDLVPNKDEVNQGHETWQEYVVKPKDNDGAHPNVGEELDTDDQLLVISYIKTQKML